MKLSYIKLALSLIILNSCGDITSSKDEDQWNVDENFTVEFRYGIYKSSLEIIEDTCTPSLKSIINSAPNWPPPYSAMPTNANRDFAVIIYHIRSGAEEDILALKTRHDKIRPNDSLSAKYPEDYDGYYFPSGFKQYCEGFDQRDYLSKRTVRSISAEKFEIEIEDEWIDFISCDYDQMRSRHRWAPKEKCKERYKIIYNIEDDIPRSCGISDPASSLLTCPVDSGNTAPYPEAAYYPCFTKEDIYFSGELCPLPPTQQMSTP